MRTETPSPVVCYHPHAIRGESLNLPGQGISEAAAHDRRFCSGPDDSRHLVRTVIIQRSICRRTCPRCAPPGPPPTTGCGRGRAEGAPGRDPAALAFKVVFQSALARDPPPKMSRAPERPAGTVAWRLDGDSEQYPRGKSRFQHVRPQAKPNVAWSMWRLKVRKNLDT